MGVELPIGPEQVEALLIRHGVKPTSQRITLAGILFSRPHHWSADDVYVKARALGGRVSRATVYNTLGLFVSAGLLRPVVIDPAKVFYDSNTRVHHHVYDVSTGTLTDVDPEVVSVAGLPDVPPGKEIEGIDVVVRVRDKDEQ